jgi:hypothetical protein
MFLDIPVQIISDSTLKHSNGPYGKNLFLGGGSQWQPKDAAAFWINEYNSFNYNSCMCHHNDTCGHYSQIVWSNSQRVSCARVVCQTGDTFMTCNYYPPGNYEDLIKSRGSISMLGGEGREKKRPSRRVTHCILERSTAYGRDLGAGTRHRQCLQWIIDY